MHRFGIAFGDSPANSAGILGSPASLGGLMYNVGAVPNADLAGTIPLTVFFVFQMMFAVITPSLIIGSVADRCGPCSVCVCVCVSGDRDI